MLPGLVIVAAKREEAIDDERVRPNIDQPHCRPLHQCAFLMDASEKQQRCTGAARLAEKLGGLRSRAVLRLAGERNDTIFVATRKIPAERSHKRLHQGFVLGGLVLHLARGVGIEEIDNGDGRLLARRICCAGW